MQIINIYLKKKIEESLSSCSEAILDNEIIKRIYFFI